MLRVIECHHTVLSSFGEYRDSEKTYDRHTTAEITFDTVGYGKLCTVKNECIVCKSCDLLQSIRSHVSLLGRETSMTSHKSLVHILYNKPLNCL